MTHPTFIAPLLPLCARPLSAPPLCAPTRPAQPRALPLRPAPVRMHGPSSTSPSPPSPSPSPTAKRRPGERKGFVEEMRFVAMRLHTKDQAPREGGQEASALPIDAWYPAKADFLQFLVDSRCVYAYFEQVLTAEPGSLFARFANTGLERLPALDNDIAYLENMGIRVEGPTPAATRYVEYLEALVGDKPEIVLCHWYNYYFAHSAGGRMIGRLMQDRLFGGRVFNFYQWEGDVKDILGEVRLVIDDVAKDWSRELKDECLKETALAFGYSGTVLQNLAKAAAS